MDHTTTAEAEIAESLQDGQQDHPALARLARRLEDDGTAADVITSYDRMHHRHNRS